MFKTETRRSTHLDDEGAKGRTRVCEQHEDDDEDDDDDADDNDDNDDDDDDFFGFQKFQIVEISVKESNNLRNKVTKGER